MTLHPLTARLRSVLVTTGESQVSAGLLMVRAYLGTAILLAHAMPKLFEMLGGEGHFPELVASMGFPVPMLFAWLATMAQVAGATLLILGAGTRLAALAVGSTLGIGILGVHFGHPFPVVEAGLVYLLLLLTFAIVGGGRYSVDHAWTRTPSDLPP